MKSETRILYANINHMKNEPTTKDLDKLCEKYEEGTAKASPNYWIGYWEGVKFAYGWVLELSK